MSQSSQAGVHRQVDRAQSKLRGVYRVGLMQQRSDA